MPRTTSRIPQVEGLRAVAAGLVFLTHLSQLTGFTSNSPVGPVFARFNVGVTVFFVITGYLLYRPWVAARLEGRPGPRIGRYVVRRLARIMPAYWVALVVLGLLLPGFVKDVFGSEWWVSFGLLQTYSYGWIFNGLRVTWSLSTEVAFYALLPLLAVVTANLFGRRARPGQVRAELWALAASAIASIVLLKVALDGEWARTYANTILGTWPWFVVGMMLAVATAAWAHDDWADAPRVLLSARRHPWLWWIAGGVLLLCTALESVLPREVFFMTHNEIVLETVLFSLFAALLVAPVVLGEASSRGAPASLLAMRPVVWLGTVSYGIFLWHLPIIQWAIRELPDAPVPVIGVISLSITLVCATASWYLVERPLIALAHRRLTDERH